MVTEKKPRKVVKYLTAEEKVINLFKEEMSNNVEQYNYERFKASKQTAKEESSKIMSEIVSTIDLIATTEEVILKSAIAGIIATDSIANLKTLSFNLERLKHTKSELDNSIKYNEELMNKLNTASLVKLFNYWKILRCLNPKIVDWPIWNHSYDGVIF